MRSNVWRGPCLPRSLRCAPLPYPNKAPWRPIGERFAAALQFDVLFSDANALKKIGNGDTEITETISPDAKCVEDTLYYQICRHGVEQAARLRAVLKQKGYRLMPDSPTNQLFVELTREKADYLSRYLTYGQWEPPHGDFLTVRFATSWATRSRDIDLLIKLV